MQNKTQIAIANDHGGYNLTVNIIKRLAELPDISVTHMGTYNAESTDYPDYAARLSKSVAAGDYSCGILICGTGIGMSIAANKIKGIRAALCHESFSAEMARKHNNANVLCLGARVTGDELAWAIVKTFLGTDFEGGRHAARVEKITMLEKDSPVTRDSANPVPAGTSD